MGRMQKRWKEIVLGGKTFSEETKVSRKIPAAALLAASHASAI